MPDILLFIITILILVIFRSKFSFPDTPLSVKKKIFLIVFAVIFLGLNIAFIGSAYYLAYNPDYGYETMRKSVGYNIYTPSYIPGERVQTSKFHIWEKGLAGKSAAVRAVYSTPIRSLLEGEKSKPVVIIQVKTDSGFDLKNYLDGELGKITGEKAELTSVSLSSWPNQTAYISERLFGNSNLHTLHVMAPDGVLVSITAIGETRENVIRMAESLN